MNGFLSSAAVRLNPLIGLVITLAGALIGGKLAGDAPLGILLGLIGGSAVAIGLCGAIAMLGQVVDAIEQPAAAQTAATAGHAMARATASAANGAAGAATASSAAIDVNATQAAIRAAGGDLDAATAGLDEGLADLIKKGDFSGFHITKAKKALAEGNYKDAAYQAAAALSHDPSNAEAKAVRATARQKR